jgi:cytochrome c oxidase subunit IV
MNTEHQGASSEVTFHHKPASDNVKRIWKTFWVLLIITIVELGIGLLMYFLNLPDDLRRLTLKGVITILSLAKAYYIVSVFMHLGDEIRNMIMTIVVPLMLFIWFIIAFIADGNSYKNLRNKYDQHFKENTMPVEEKEKEKEKKEEKKETGKPSHE